MRALSADLLPPWWVAPEVVWFAYGPPPGVR